MEPVLLKRDGAIATVTLSNPDRLNALNKPMWQQLGTLMREASADDALRCVVVRGAGDKAFAAGADISEFARERADSKQAKQYGALIHDTLRAVAKCRHPVVAMIKGACVGGGIEITAMCDMRICGESSRFGVPEIPEHERDEGFACFDTEDYAIGVAAFLAKTKPQFKGR